MQLVTENRNNYIGGSDIPIIMGISPFKKRFDLLLEKASLLDVIFGGNEYTDYGNKMEDKIRQHINKKYETNFVEGKHIIEEEIISLRGHCDGINEDCILEIKTTSHIYKDVDDYKIYLVQLLFYMQIFKRKKGMLAVYERPSNFDENFDENRLFIYHIEIEDYEELLVSINNNIRMFKQDLKKLQENPFLTEEELQPNEVIELSQKVYELELRLKEYKKLEKEQEEIKAKLCENMKQNGIKSWRMNNGTLITLVLGKEASEEIIKEFNVNKFKEENEEMYENYLEDKVKKTSARKDSLRITYKEN